jgi:Lipid A 3-O-deacylase (PagL)
MKLGRFGLAAGMVCVALAGFSQFGFSQAGSSLPGPSLQGGDAAYSRKNTFSGFFEYSNDSSHIILGNSENRKIGAIGFQYQRRLVHRSLFDFSYTAEARPGMLESDPVLTQTVVQTSPVPGSSPEPSLAVVRCIRQTSAPVVTVIGPTVYSYVVVDTCTRRTVVEQGFSPVGVRLSLMPRHRLQLTFSSLAGYMFSSQEVPVPNAGAFNFTFEFGGGLEWYRTRTQSVRLEYQVQHYSDKQTSVANPGVDSGFVKLTYAFGK